jgi:TPR repeat protein
VVLESYDDDQVEKVFPGDGQEENRRRWIHEAAVLGNPAAMQRWAGVLSAGVEVARDLAAAKQLLQRAVAAGSETAGVDLLYLERDLREQDEVPVPDGDRTASSRGSSRCSTAMTSRAATWRPIC